MLGARRCRGPSSRRLASAALALAVLAFPAPGRAQATAFVDLGTDHVAAVSGDGRVAVGRQQDRAYRWEGGTLTLLGLLEGGTESAALGVSADGSVVVGRGDFADPPNVIPTVHGEQGARWDGSVPTGLAHGFFCFGPPCLFGESLFGIATDVTDDGAVPVGTMAPFIYLAAVRWDPAIRFLTPDWYELAPPGVMATGVSADGGVTVGWSQRQPPIVVEASRWDPEGNETLLGVLSGHDRSRARGISSDGTVSVGESGTATASQAFRFESGTMTGLGDLPGGALDSAALAVSGNGDRVVGRGSTASGGAAFVWDATHGMREIAAVLAADGVDLTGWALLEATGVSDDGRTIVGNGTFQGAPRAWLAALAPETAIPALPTLGVLVLTGLLAASGIAAAATRASAQRRRRAAKSYTGWT